MKIKILSLDLATKTGWATNCPPTSGVQDFSVQRGESVGMKYVRFRAWLVQMADMIKPDLIAYEQAHHRGGAATESAAGFATHLQAFTAEKKIELTVVHSSTVKKFATGKGNATKDMMMAAYLDLFGKKPIDNNEADARWILEWAISRFGKQ